MAFITVTGTVKGKVWNDKGINIVESYKNADGKEISRYYTAWFESPQGIEIGSAISVSGVLSVKVTPKTGTDGIERHFADISINKSEIKQGKGDAIVAKAEELLDSPF